MTKEEILRIIEELETFEPYEECVPPYYLINEMPMQLFKLRAFVNEYYSLDGYKFKRFNRMYDDMNRYIEERYKLMTAREILDAYDKIDFAELWVSGILDREMIGENVRKDLIREIRKNENVILFNQILYAKYSIPKEHQTLKGGIVLTQEEAKQLYDLSIKLRYGEVIE